MILAKMFRKQVVFLQRLSYPCTVKQLATEFCVPIHRLCEIIHTALESVFNKYHMRIEFDTWLPFFSQFQLSFPASNCSSRASFFASGLSLIASA